ncbi:LysR family transcriptional regulator [Paenibacillus agricola]|uniref:LysR family transcriptional regulator n=1 Tax=Paenibacillus agricola TaxID=2716264 RepID=A0ABX0J0C7_9BACL|nr:LysR family transcriptional regulator [Paenibacillus agricola]NHN29722.1 LysR family transcriptional regulator [Paenibacillus agricola]
MLTNLESYRVFYIIAKAGSFSRAAEELYITQPAVSYAIKQLEEKLGGKLFFRTSKGVELTHEGEVLFRYIEKAYHLIQAGEKELTSMHELHSGEIAIGASDTLCKHYLLPHVEQFHHSFPFIKLKVTNRTTQETIALLKQGKVDFGIVNLPIEDRQLQVQEALELQDTFVAGKAYNELAKERLAMERLVTYPLLLLEQGSSIRRYADRFAESQGLKLQPEIELGSIDLLVDFARIGLGIAYVIRNFVTAELAAGTLVEIKLKQPIPPRQAGIVTLKGVPISAAAKQFIELLLPENSKEKQSL